MQKFGSMGLLLLQKIRLGWDERVTGSEEKQQEGSAVSEMRVPWGKGGKGINSAHPRLPIWAENWRMVGRSSFLPSQKLWLGPPMGGPEWKGSAGPQPIREQCGEQAPVLRNSATRARHGPSSIASHRGGVGRGLGIARGTASTRGQGPKHASGIGRHGPLALFLVPALLESWASEGAEGDLSEPDLGCSSTGVRGAVRRSRLRQKASTELDCQALRVTKIVGNQPKIHLKGERGN